jgi:hypothetical protein
MDTLSKFLNDHLPLLLLWLLVGLFAGLVYAVELLGVDGSMTLLSPERARSLHLSLMLYGFVPLVLSLLPFALFDQEGVLTPKALRHLNRYMVVWNTFLLFMTLSLVFGNLRGLPFYDFPYQLNGILALSGVFYALALVESLKQYHQRPLWVTVSLWVVVIAPIALMVLMNPHYGQVEQTLYGPHGDNTLGMSFALIPLYYLLLKLSRTQTFIPRYPLLWMIPLGGYGVSLIIRNFVHPLSYNEEWFFQYLTFFYLPLLWVWVKDAGVSIKTNPYLILSIGAFMLVDIEGNILFIPTLRAMMHRNDLVVGHAHIAMGIAVAFMALSIAHHLLPKLFRRGYALIWSGLLMAIALVLSGAGVIESGIMEGSIEPLFIARIVFGLGVVALSTKLLWDRVFPHPTTPLEWYHVIGFLGDFGGGMLLILVGKGLFGYLGFAFSGTYEYLVFTFVMGTGIIHWFGWQESSDRLAHITAIIRIMVSGMFSALYMAGILDTLAWVIAVYDGVYAMIYFLGLRK